MALPNAVTVWQSILPSALTVDPSDSCNSVTVCPSVSFDSWHIIEFIHTYFSSISIYWWITLFWNLAFIYTEHRWKQNIDICTYMYVCIYNIYIYITHIYYNTYKCTFFHATVFSHVILGNLKKVIMTKSSSPRKILILLQ